PSVACRAAVLTLFCGPRNATEGVPYSVRILFVRHHAARLATAALLALWVRAAVAQPANPVGPRGDPYAPQWQQPYPPAAQPQPPDQQPLANQALRYPLPAAAELPPVVRASAMRALPGFTEPPAPPPAPVAPPAWSP